MGLQVWPPSKPPPPSSMACLDVETPTVCRVLQLCLQQRRSREQLVEQGIMPPLKMPASFHDQIRHLERARTGNFLKHKICNRPERSELVRMHILQETQAEPSLHATQMRLKRARLADDLNEKLAQRPGAMELVVKNILPVVDSAPSKDPPIAEQGNDPRIQDVYNFDENSTDSHPAAESAERTPKQTPQQPPSASPPEAATTEASSPPAGPDHTLLPGSPPCPPQSASDPPGLGCSAAAATQRPGKHPVVLQPLAAAPANAPPPARWPILVKQSQPRSVSTEKNRAKKANKDPKPRVKKLKYHQYVPPDQKDSCHEAPLDSAYVRLLQQQQQFLQLQILRQQQQQQHFVCQAVQQPAAFSDGPAHSTRTPPPSMSDHLPSNLDEMKVAELKTELKLRGLLVSGTKNDLIERLRSHHERSKGGGPGVPVATETASPGALVAGVQKCENAPRSGSPVSPVVFKVSKMGLDERGAADADTRSPARPCGSPRPSSAQEEEEGGRRCSEKDQRLREKERQIEELTRQLEREQRLVEELKMQLEAEKRGHHHEEGGALRPPPQPLVRVKEECCASPVGLEQVTSGQSPSRPQQQFFLSRQQSPTLAQTLRPGARLHQPAAAAAGANLPDDRRHAAAPGGVAPDNNQTRGLMPQKHEASGSLQQQCQSPSPGTQSSQPSTPPGLTSQVRTTQAQEDAAQHLLHTAPPSMPMMSKSKDPPRYEDAVKQTRCMQTAMQVPHTLSQHMDDLFDVLIESGEITPFIGQDSSCAYKHIPVTASVTTLPVNTVLSRPPAQIQVAQPPDAPLNPTPGLMALVTMETLIEGTLRKQLLDHPLVGNMELDFSDSPAMPSAGHLQNGHLESMDWLDLTTLPPHGHGEADAHLEMSPEAGVFSPDFLESPEFQLNWE